MKTGEEFYTCSELRRTKCPCMAMVRYFKKFDKSVPLGPPSIVPSACDGEVGDHAAVGQGHDEGQVVSIFPHYLQLCLAA